MIEHDGSQLRLERTTSGACAGIRESTGPTARILIGGDLCPTGRAEARLARGNPQETWAGITRQLEAADLSMANLECPLTRGSEAITKNGPSLRADPACASGIKAGGFDVMTLANNHMMDMGPCGLMDTIRHCRDAGMDTVGAGSCLDEALEPLFVERHGIRLAIVAVAEREFSAAERTTAGVAPAVPELTFDQMRRAKALSDVVVVVVHGGNEYFAYPRPNLVRYCRFLVQAGASAVVCHHSHMVGTLELYRGAPIVYGVGNLLFDPIAPKSEEWHRGCLVELGIDANGVFSCGISLFEQFLREPAIVNLPDAAVREMIDKVLQRAMALKDPEQLEREWQSFCRAHRDKYLVGLRSPVLFPGVARVFRTYPYLMKILLLGSARNRLLNWLRTDSHREAIETILEEEAANGRR